MDIKVNILELASELAHKELEDVFNGDNVRIYDEPEAGITSYTDEAQDVFNELYDIYYDIILKCKL